MSILKEDYAGRGITYTDELIFNDGKIQEKVEKKSPRVKLTIQQKWLGFYFTKDINSLKYPEFSIRKVNKFIGYGVFAEKEIPPNTYIGEYTGLIRKRKFWESKRNAYLFEYYLGELFLTKYVIDAESFGNHTRFINHSDNPNLEPLAVVVEGKLRIILYSKKSIRKGEQFSYDYGTGYWNARLKLTLNAK